MKHRHSLYPYLLLSLTAVLGVLLSITSSFLVSRWEYSKNQAQLQKRIDNLTTALQRNINRYTDVLLSISDFYAVSQLQVSQKEFQVFVRRSLLSYAGIQALEWAPQVPYAQRANYEQTIRAMGYPNFVLQEQDVVHGLVPVRKRPTYTPVTYIEPWKDNEAALGYDLASDPTRQQALNQARDTGETVATGRIKLVQERKNQYGFLVFLPIYQSQPIPDNLASRRAALAGYLLGVFRVADVIEESLADLNISTDFYIYDQSATAHDQFLGYYDSVTRQLMVESPAPISHIHARCPDPLLCTRTLSVGGRQWVLLFQPKTSAEIENWWRTGVTLVIGLLLTGSIVLYQGTSIARLEKNRELSELKLRFFSMASHEFRTPLSTILLSAQSLETNHDIFTEAQKAKSIQRIKLAAQKITQMLNDILMLSRAEANKLEVVPELFNLRQFCLQLVEDIQTEVTAESRIQFTCSGSCDRAYLDKKLLYSLLSNLLSNALKYSPPDTQVELSLACTAQTAIFQICDRGIGIPPEDQPQLYEGFYRGRNVSHIPGTGLGLTVVKTSVDLQSGQIWVDSDLGKGTTFTVTLPLGLV